MKKDYKAEIDNWLNDLSEESLQKIGQVVELVNIEWELQGFGVFQFPYHRINVGSLSETDVELILSQLRKKGLFLDVGIPDVLVIPTKEGYKEFPPYEKPFKYLVSKLRLKLNKEELDKTFVWFKNNSLIMNLPDGSPGAIEFGTRSGNNDMLAVFEIIFEHWRTSKETEFRGGWWEVPITKDMIRAGLEKRGKKDLHSKFITNNISYIRNLKVKPSKLSGLVALSDFNPKIDGWVFKIKKP